MNQENRPLWAPWRIEFIRGEKKPGCFLCGKKEKFDSPEEELIVARMKHCFVILNRYPYNSGHLLIAPYEHCGDITLLAPEARHEIIDTCAAAQNILKDLLHPQGFNVGFNFGTAAGAGVAEHIHLHIVPRWVGDNNFMPVIGDIRCVPEALVNTAKLIRENWKV